MWKNEQCVNAGMSKIMCMSIKVDVRMYTMYTNRRSLVDIFTTEVSLRLGWCFRDFFRIFSRRDQRGTTSKILNAIKLPNPQSHNTQWITRITGYWVKRSQSQGPIFNLSLNSRHLNLHQLFCHKVANLCPPNMHNILSFTPQWPGQLHCMKQFTFQNLLWCIGSAIL